MKNKVQARLKHFFASGDLQLKFYILATLTGILTGGTIIVFRLLIEQAQISIFPSGEIEDFASVQWYWILGLPILGGAVIGLLFHGLSAEQRTVGVMHVIERLSYYQGRMPVGNVIRQFIGAAIALMSGHSVGRESPSVHIGAASGSFFGVNLDLPNNAKRMLVASGSAAAIAASFNTPIAGVIFAMEVIMMEYQIATFIPIILASVSGAVLSRLAFDEPPFFGIVATQMQSLWELPYIIVLGVFLGLIAVLFIKSLVFFSGFLAKQPVWQRTTLAGVIVGLGGLIMPDVMGMSYNLISSAHLTELAIPGLLTLLFLKLALSSACVGLGIPGGLIGPTMVIGAAGGAMLGYIGQSLAPGLSSSIGFYAMIGMCAMLGSTLKAPLAGLMTLMELTANPHIILPGMLAIVFASLIVIELFKLDSVFLELLRRKGMDYGGDPLVEAMRRISVTRAMARQFELCQVEVTKEKAKELLVSSPVWIIIEQDSDVKSLLLAADLARAVNECETDTINLLDIPGSRQQLAKVSVNDSLQEAIEKLNSPDIEALYVTRRLGLLTERIEGVLTPNEIQAQYQVTNS